MRKWEDLTKEQKQLVAMSGVLVVIVLFLLFQFGVSPFLAKKAQMTLKYEGLQAQLNQAAQVIQNEAQIRESLADKLRLLEQAQREYIPAPENPLSWATKKIYGEARLCGVEIESVSEIDQVATSWTGPAQEKRAFKPYAVRVATQCSFAQLIRLVRVLETINPHMFVSSITVQSQEGKLDRHLVGFTVEWPQWKSVEKIPTLKEADAPSKPAATSAVPSAVKS